jgi:hypothetical protein
MSAAKDLSPFCFVSKNNDIEDKENLFCSYGTTPHA